MIRWMLFIDLNPDNQAQRSCCFYVAPDTGGALPEWFTVSCCRCFTEAYHSLIKPLKTYNTLDENFSCQLNHLVSLIFCSAFCLYTYCCFFMVSRSLLCVLYKYCFEPCGKTICHQSCLMKYLLVYAEYHI